MSHQADTPEFMHVLGELIDLSPELDGGGLHKRLPIPWYQRAPLGLLSETVVFVSLQYSTKDENEQPKLGDLIVSVIDPTRTILRINIRRNEATGAVDAVFQDLQPIFADNHLNIALAETVTTGSRANHDLSLTTELLVEMNDEQVEALANNIQDLLSGDEEPCQVHIQKPLDRLVWLGKGVVRNGYLCDCDWHSAIQDRFSLKNEAISRAVVYSDQVARLARFVFPAEKAMTISIEHADVPGALDKLTSALKECRLNLLSTLLRRGGVTYGNASLISVCEVEETSDIRTMDEIRDEVTHAIRDISLEFRPGVPHIREARKPQSVVMARHPEDRVIQVPQRLRSSVRTVRNACDGRTPVFLSRRFTSDSYRSRQVARIVRDVLEDHGFEPVEAHPDPLDENPTTIEQVEARLWASDLGIVLIVDSEDVDPFSGNLAHEYGFLHGQDKPVVFLVDKPLVNTVNSTFVTNLQGLVVVSFAAGDGAYDKDDSQSVEVKLSEWLKRAGERLKKDT